MLAIALLAGIAACCGCETRPPRKSDAELGLTPQQAAGRRVYDAYCLGCHEAYMHGGRRGPSLMGVFQKKELPSGTPANDQRVSEVILQGRAKMPAFHDRINDQQLEELIAYMHTL
ncbi:MAG: cytochrome c [Acidobacteriaceae bacterium]|nr:cytochrome c [Acidobacteriaceae bacterium]